MVLGLERFLPYSRQILDEEDKDAVLRVLESDLITQGPYVEKFESAVAAYVGSRYAVACATGTAALHLSCLALDISSGDSLVTSPLTFLASANCAQYVGADTLFSDIDADSWCLCMPTLQALLEVQKE